MSVGKNIDFNNCQIGRPAVVGIYGLPGSGKTFVLDALKHAFETSYILVEGSEVISKLVHGGLQAFEALDEAQKKATRELALRTIVADCLNDGKAAVVTGHFMFWSSKEEQGISVWTQADLENYTHIIYLNTPPKTIHHRRFHDDTKTRPQLTVDHLHRWQREEEFHLRSVCLSHGIIYCAMENESLVPKVTQMLELFLQSGQEIHNRQSETRLDSIMASSRKDSVSALVLDADKTLSAADSGELFWKHVHRGIGLQKHPDYLRNVFSGPLGYTSAAFLQVALLYEELVDQGAFDEVCTNVAAEISLYPEVTALLLRVQNDAKTVAVVLTCGLLLIWEKVLERHGLSDNVKVIGSGPLSGARVITPIVKARLVARLQKRHGLRVVAIGDSVLDLDMFAQAERAVVIVGDEQTRSRSMEVELARSLRQGRFSACQAILARRSPPRLNTGILPLVDLNDSDFWDCVLLGAPPPMLNIVHFTDTRVSKILATPMRDAANSGPALRHAHCHSGRYLALHALPDLLGVEEHTIRHVQGNDVPGSRIAQQDRILIVALMRGGEPMALGVNEILPMASFLHARHPEEVRTEHVDSKSVVILVDSVINTGQTVVDFIRHLTNLNATVRILVIAGVVQNEAIANMEALKTTIQRQPIALVALRFSNNKFTGRGGTDTGNRLYHTETLK